MTQRHRLIEALRMPVHDRLPIRRSTVVLAVLLIGLAVLYSSIEPSPKTVALCSADGRCSNYVQAPSSNSKAPKNPATTTVPPTTTPPTTVTSTTTTPTTTTPTSPNRPGTTVPGTTIPQSPTTTTTLPGGATTSSSTSTSSTTSTTSIP